VPVPVQCQCSAVLKFNETVVVTLFAATPRRSTKSELEIPVGGGATVGTTDGTTATELELVDGPVATRSRPRREGVTVSPVSPSALPRSRLVRTVSKTSLPVLESNGVTTKPVSALPRRLPARTT